MNACLNLLLTVGVFTLGIFASKGPTRPTINCPHKLCHGQVDGNYEVKGEPNYFVKCVSELAYCQACWPLHLVFSERCNQCLYGRNDNCFTKIRFQLTTTFQCPDLCPRRGNNFNGNIEDPLTQRQYIACWNGVTVGCISCPGKLKFNERWNACLYESCKGYRTIPKPTESTVYRGHH